MKGRVVSKASATRRVVLTCETDVLVVMVVLVVSCVVSRRSWRQMLRTCLTSEKCDRFLRRTIGIVWVSLERVYFYLSPSSTLGK